MEPIAIERTVDLDCTTDELWRLISDEAELARWMGPHVELDLRPDGRGVVVEDDGTTRHLIVREVVDGERLAFEWWSDGDELGATVVVFVVAATDDGSRLTVTETAGAQASSWDARLISLWLSVCALARG
jgi:uncharacterized protein YndB with AHSA1/START domain